jgi:hypothetical protein
MLRITDTGIHHIDSDGMPVLSNATVLVPMGQEFEVADKLESSVHSLEVRDMDDGRLNVVFWQSMQGVLHRAAAAL